MTAMLAYAERNGVVVLAGAGNCGEEPDTVCVEKNDVVYPAGFPSVLAVAAYDDDGDRQDDSSANASVDVAAPGNKIVSTCLVDGANDRPTCELTGTSMAAPHVAATAALLLARQPDASPAAVREAITGAARPPDGHVKGVRTDEFGYGRLDPVAAADYLNRWPQGQGSAPEQPPDDRAIAGETVVAGYTLFTSEAGGVVGLARADGSSTLVQGATGSGTGRSEIGFSPDGRWFATTSGLTITFVDVTSGRQRNADCLCNGVVFTADGLAATVDNRGDVPLYDPETATVEKVLTPDYEGVDATVFHVLAVAGDVIILYAGKAGLVGIDPSGRPIPIHGLDPDSGIGDVAVSADGNRIAYAANQHGGGCGDDWIRVIDLKPKAGHESRDAALAGPAGGGDVAVDLQFDGDKLVAAWSPPRSGSGSCAEGQPPQLWSYQPVASDFELPATVREPKWEPGVENRGFSRPTPTGEAIYTQLTGTGPGWHYQLWFGPHPQGQGSTLLAEAVTVVAVRPNIPTGSGTDAQAEVWRTYAPKVYLAEGEDNTPMSARDYIAGSKLVWSHSDACGDHTEAEEGQVDQGKLAAGQYARQEAGPRPRCARSGREWRTNERTRPNDSDGPADNEGWLLDGNDDLHNGQGTDAPAYVQYLPYRYAIYWFFYPWNDAPGFQGQGGDHEGDWERVAVQFDEANQPVSVVYWFHTERCFVPWDQAPKDGVQPLVFSASGTHGSYPSPGVRPLPDLPVLNDEASEGDLWDTWSHLTPVEEEPWWGYAGGWGEVGKNLPLIGTIQTGPSGPSPLRNIQVATDKPCD